MGRLAADGRHSEAVACGRNCTGETGRSVEVRLREYRHNIKEDVLEGHRGNLE
jgi:hypothetical protein